MSAVSSPSMGTERFERGTVRVGSIVIRCYEFDRMLAFWSEALGYEPREPAEDGWVVLRKPEGGGPQPVPGEGRATVRSPWQEQQGAPGPLHRRPEGRGGEAARDRGDQAPTGIRAGRRLRGAGRPRRQSLLCGCEARRRLEDPSSQLPRTTFSELLRTPFGRSSRKPFRGSLTGGGSSVVAGQQPRARHRQSAQSGVS